MDKKTNEELIEFYNKVYEDNMMWFALASYISADNFWEINDNTTEDNYNELVEKYNHNISKLEEIVYIIDCCDKVPEIDQKKINDYAVDGAVILKDELETVKNKWKAILERRNK